MSFHFGAKSEAQLATVHPDLARVIRAALAVTAQDFTVQQGERSRDDQTRAWLRKASKLNGYPKGEPFTFEGKRYTGTGRGNHQAKADGWAHAADLAPWVNGAASDDWRFFWPLAVAVSHAARESGVPVTWGAIWDRDLGALNLATEADAKREVEAYKARHAGADFLDGYHFELRR